MHDAVIAERAKVPALAVMTEKFVNAAQLMSSVLGMPDYEFAIIRHPVSSASDEGLREEAEATIDVLTRIILSYETD